VRRGTALKVIVVSNSPIAVPRDDFIERVVVGAGMDEADNYIADVPGQAASWSRPMCRLRRAP